MNVLVVTNDFPPRAGGIQQYTHNLTSRLTDDAVTIYAPASPGAAEFDAEIRATVVRHPGERVLPVPDVRRRVVELVRTCQADVVVFPSTLPLGLLAGPITAATGVPCVGFTHGVEVALGRAAGVRAAMRRIANDMRLLTAVSAWAARRLEAVVAGRCAVELLVSGVAIDRYRPDVDGSAVRARLSLGDAPVCVCVSRLVARKGQDVLIASWPAVVAAIPRARLLIVGGGPDEPRLGRAAAASPVAGQIVFTGEVDWDDMPAHYAAGDVFAMPCRTRWGGLDVEALGAVFLEASATGLAVVAGRSGGAAETVVDGVTGLLVDGRDVPSVAAAVTRLLADHERARLMGVAGRRRVEEEFSWEAVVARLRSLLAGVVSERAAA